MYSVYTRHSPRRRYPKFKLGWTSRSSVKRGSRHAYKQFPSYRRINIRGGFNDVYFRILGTGVVWCSRIQNRDKNKGSVKLWSLYLFIPLFRVIQGLWILFFFDGTNMFWILLVGETDLNMLSFYTALVLVLGLHSTIAQVINVSFTFTFLVNIIDWRVSI